MHKVNSSLTGGEEGGGGGGGISDKEWKLVGKLRLHSHADVKLAAAVGR